MANEDEIAERIQFLKKRIMTLEWDKNLNQLNESMILKFEDYKKEYDELLRQNPPSP